MSNFKNHIPTWSPNNAWYLPKSTSVYSLPPAVPPTSTTKTLHAIVADLDWAEGSSLGSFLRELDICALSSRWLCNRRLSVRSDENAGAYVVTWRARTANVEIERIVSYAEILNGSIGCARNVRDNMNAAIDKLIEMDALHPYERYP